MKAWGKAVAQYFGTCFAYRKFLPDSDTYIFRWQMFSDGR